MSEYTKLDSITRYDGMLDCLQKKKPESIDIGVDFHDHNYNIIRHQKWEPKITISENMKFKCPCCESVFDLYNLLGVGDE